MPHAKVGQPKQLGFWAIYLLGINGVIGSGAFLLPQVIYQQMDLYSLLVLIFAAITVTMIALCYADLASRFSGAGAAWLYSYHAFGTFVGYELGIFVWFMGLCTMAAETVGLFTTLRGFIPAFKNDQVFLWSCVGLIVLFGIINLFGRTLVKWVDNISSAAKVITIIIFIVVGVFFIRFSNFTPVLPVSAESVGGFSSHFGNAFSNVFYFFTGFSLLPIAASQMKDPEKNLPRVLIFVMVTVTVLYALMFLVAIGILGARLANFDLPIAAAFQSAIGEWGYAIIIMGMICSIFGVGFAASFDTPAALASLATEHHMVPDFFGKSNRFDAPWVSILVTTVIGAILVTQSYFFLVGLIVLTAFIQYVPTILAVIKFKHTKQFPNNGFSLKGGFTIPIIALIISFYMIFQFTWLTVVFAIVVAIVGAIIYAFMDARKMGTNSSVEDLKALRFKKFFAEVGEADKEKIDALAQKTKEDIEKDLSHLEHKEK